MACWLLGYAGLIYGTGAFTAVYMVDHGATAHFVFLTFACAYAVTFVAFQVNSRLGDRIERRDVMCSMAVTQRSEFASVIQRNGGQVQGLITALRQKTEAAGLQAEQRSAFSRLRTRVRCETV